MDNKSDFLKFTLDYNKDFAEIKTTTCSDVIDALWPWRTAKGAHVRRHQTRIILSQLPAAIIVFS